MTPRELEEYRALRATIRERGTARLHIFVGGLLGWAGLVVLTTATMIATETLNLPVATLLPLLALAGVFEAVLALHIGVERVGRYIQVFFEADDDSTRRWEHEAMKFGAQAGRGTPDPLFTPFFLLAAGLNIVPTALAAALPVEWAVVGALHVLFVFRVVSAKRMAAGQRARDLARFEELKGSRSQSGTRDLPKA